MAFWNENSSFSTHGSAFSLDFFPVPRHIVGAEIRYPFVHLAELLLLDFVLAVSYICVMERNCASHCVEVVSSAAGCTGVDPKSGVAEYKLVPVSEISLNVEVFARSLFCPLLRLQAAGFRVKVEVLTVHSYVTFLYDGVYAWSVIHSLASGLPRSSS